MILLEHSYAYSLMCRLRLLSSYGRSEDLETEIIWPIIETSMTLVLNSSLPHPNSTPSLGNTPPLYPQPRAPLCHYALIMSP